MAEPMLSISYIVTQGFFKLNSVFLSLGYDDAGYWCHCQNCKKNYETWALPDEDGILDSPFCIKCEFSEWFE